MSVKRLSLDRFTLKTIAVAAMFVDHFAAMFLVGLTAGRFGWVYYVCRFIGRMTAPIMCFFLSEGFIHTSSRKRYIERMALFALISQPFYTLAFYGTVFTFNFSMIFTLFVSLIMLGCWERIGNPVLRWLAVAACVIITIPSDWYVFAPVMVLGCYVMRAKGNLRLLVPGIVSLFLVVTQGLYSVWGAFMHLGMVVSVILLALYNGGRGKRSEFSKWFFYVFYPAHLYLLWIVQVFLKG